MPTVLSDGPYRFHFYMQDLIEEPPHVHVERDRYEAKVWLDPVRLERAGGYPGHELRKILRLVEEHEQFLLEEWHARKP